MVQSGFDAQSAEDEEYYGSSGYGWKLMMTGLQHYLEKHAGTPRLVAWSRRKIAVTREAAYARLVAANGLFQENPVEALKPGARYSLRTRTGETFTGLVKFVAPPRGFCLGVDLLNDAIFWL